MTKNFFFKYKKMWKKKSFKVSKSISLTTHIIVVISSLCAGIIFFIFVNTFILPTSLELPKTTAINWLVLNRHSMTLDYVRFFAFIVIIQTFIMVGWIFFVWKKSE